jgi:hypothetical protein
LAKDKTRPPGAAPWSPTFLAPLFPLPDDIAETALKDASIVVSARPERGRRRAGFAFTREKTAIALADLEQDQIAALAGDPELDVSLRLPKPDAKPK